MIGDPVSAYPISTTLFTDVVEEVAVVAATFASLAGSAANATTLIGKASATTLPGKTGLPIYLESQ